MHGSTQAGLRGRRLNEYCTTGPRDASWTTHDRKTGDRIALDDGGRFGKLRTPFHPCLVTSQGDASVCQSSLDRRGRVRAFALASARAGPKPSLGFSLNPFAKSSESKKASSGFKLPSLWPASDQKKVRNAHRSRRVGQVHKRHEVDVRQDDGCPHVFGTTTSRPQNPRPMTACAAATASRRRKRRKQVVLLGCFQSRRGAESSQDGERVPQSGQAAAVAASPRLGPAKV